MFSKQVALIIDQDKMSAQTIMRILRDDLGFKKVIIAINGKSALDELRVREINWVIGEWDVPGITGAKLLKELRGNPKTAEVPFLMLSGSVDRDALLEAISLGVTDFIAKPFTPAIISSKIKRLSRIREIRFNLEYHFVIIIIESIAGGLLGYGVSGDRMLGLEWCGTCTYMGREKYGYGQKFIGWRGGR